MPICHVIAMTTPLSFTENFRRFICWAVLRPVSGELTRMAELEWKKETFADLHMMRKKPVPRADCYSFSFFCVTIGITGDDRRNRRFA